MPVQTRSQVRNQKNNAAQPKERFSAFVARECQKIREERQQESRLDWFKKYVKKTLDSQHGAPAGMEKLRIANELFFIVDEHIHEILRENRSTDSYLRFACVVFNKAHELYHQVEEIMKPRLDEIKNRRLKKIDERYVKNFVETMGKILDNFVKTFDELNLVMECEDDGSCTVLKKLGRAEEYSKICPLNGITLPLN